MLGDIKSRGSTALHKLLLSKGGPPSFVVISSADDKPQLAMNSLEKERRSLRLGTMLIDILDVEMTFPGSGPVVVAPVATWTA